MAQGQTRAHRHLRRSATSICVTHDQIEAMTLADRVVVLNKGRIEQQGTPMELYTKPANIFVAGFIGSPAMNFLEATVEHSSAGAAIRLASGSKLEIPDSDTGRTGKVVLSLRPEDLEVRRDGGIPAKVRLIEPTGAQAHVVFEVGSEKLMAVVDSEMSLVVGDVVELGISHSNGCICLILTLALASIDDCYMEICDGSAFCDPLYECSFLFTS